jgi:cytosine/creatinine deaminase
MMDALGRLNGGSLVLGNARVPKVFLGAAPCSAPSLEASIEDVDIAIAGGRIQRIAPAGSMTATLDLGDRLVWPRLVDMHTHLDKSHVYNRVDNRAFNIDGARAQTMNDRARRWTREDLQRRIEFSLRCAEHHGVGAVRTHLDSQPEIASRSWQLFDEIRRDWRRRIALQAVSLVPLELYEGAYGDTLADLVATHGGVLGAVTTGPDTTRVEGVALLKRRLHRLMQLATERGLYLDLHVDETDDLALQTLSHIAECVIETGFAGKVTCGHCCLLALADPDRAETIFELLRQAGISLVTLPLANMHLQDRSRARTPRWRGVPPVKELIDGGVPVALAGDNCRDAWVSHGDGDMVETLRQSIRILHLDDRIDAALAMSGPEPARRCGFEGAGRLVEGGPADMIVFDARKANHLLARPSTARSVIRAGAAVTTPLPAYDELEDA